MGVDGREEQSGRRRKTLPVNVGCETLSLSLELELAREGMGIKSTELRSRMFHCTISAQGSASNYRAFTIANLGHRGLRVFFPN